MWKELMVTLGFWKAPPPSPGITVAPAVQTGICFTAPPLRREIKRHHAQLRRCYTRVTEYRGGPEGTVVLHLAIAKDGRVTHARTEGDLDDPRITDCVAAEARQWRFSASDTGFAISYPLHFRIAD